MFTVINRNTRRHCRRFGVLIVNFEHISHGVSIVNFEQVNAGWEVNVGMKWDKKVRIMYSGAAQLRELIWCWWLSLSPIYVLSGI